MGIRPFHKRWDLVLIKQGRINKGVRNRPPEHPPGFRLSNGEIMGVRIGEFPFQPEPAYMTKMGTTLAKTKLVKGRILGSPFEHVRQDSPMLGNETEENEDQGMLGAVPE